MVGDFLIFELVLGPVIERQIFGRQTLVYMFSWVEHSEGDEVIRSRVMTSKMFWLPAILRQEISPKKFQRYENTLFFKLILHNKNSNKVRNIILRARKYLPGTLQL